jgi:hypothetical protein
VGRSRRFSPNPQHRGLLTRYGTSPASQDSSRRSLSSGERCRRRWHISLPPAPPTTASAPRRGRTSYPMAGAVLGDLFGGAYLAGPVASDDA